MTAVMSEGALDLSSKPFESKPPSPARSIGSDLDLKCERASSVSSEEEAILHSPPKKRPYPQSFNTMRSVMPPLMKSPRASPEHSPGSRSSTPRSSTAASSPIENSPTATSAPANGSTNHSPTTGRPFKMYPFEPMPNMYSQLAAAASTGMYPYGTASPNPGMPGMGLFDSAISLSSPIGQYLQQKKRRMESRNQQMQSHPTLHIPEQIGSGGLVGGGGGTVPLSENHNHHHSKASSPGSAPSSGTSALDDSDMFSDHGGDNNCSDGESSSSSMVLTPGGLKKIKPVPDNKKDEAYWERRRKNNEAAKRSRDARRAKEEEIALRAAFLEQENLKLRAQVAILKNETAKLHYMLYNRM